MKNRSDIRLEGVERRIHRTFARTDDVRSAGLEQASLLREAKAVVARRERARLAAKHGEDSNEAADAERRVAAHVSLQAELASELGAASVRAPAVDAEHFAVYGRVVDASRRPLRGHSVTAVVADETDATDAQTDAAGRFELAVAAEPPTQPGPKDRQQDPKQAAPSERTQAPPREPTEIRLAVAGPDGRTVHAETLRIVRVGGSALYRELVVGRGRRPPDRPSPRSQAWHSVRGAVHHTHPDCNTGNNIEEENLREGTGGKPLCSECAELNRRA